MRRARAIRLKLGGSPSLADPFPEKPNGMHLRTYQRLYAQAKVREGAAIASAASWLNGFEERFKNVKFCVSRDRS
jgi:hypothetical protein